MSTQTIKSSRKPFSVGTRVVRLTDGERGTVASVVTSENNSTWLVAATMDEDGVGFMGLQLTAAQGAWRKLTAEELAEEAAQAEQREQERIKRSPRAAKRAAAAAPLAPAQALPTCICHGCEETATTTRMLVGSPRWVCAAHA